MSVNTINLRLQLSIGGLVLAVIAFLVVYFPMQQRRQELALFERELEAVGDSLAITIGVALEGRNYTGMKLASEYVERDPDLIGVLIQNRAGDLFSAYPPELGSRAGQPARDGEVSYRVPTGADESGEPTHYITLFKSLERLDHRIRATQLRILLIGACVFAAALAVARAISRSIAAPIEALGLASMALAEGRLSAQVELSRRDELGTLASGFNAMVRNLRDLVESVRGGTHEVTGVAQALDVETRGMTADLRNQRDATQSVSNATDRLGAAAKRVDSNVEKLSRSISECSVALFQMDASIRSVGENMDSLIEAIDGASTSSVETATAAAQISSSMENLSGSSRAAEALLNRMADALGHMVDNARICGERSVEVADEAARGARVVEDTSLSMQAVRDCFDDIRARIEALEETSESVGGVLQIIASITDQTNLLSLNAAIIAAQAGERGKGFGVVADQIKVLSNQTSESAREVEALISRVRRETGETANAVTRGAETVESCFARSHEAGGLLDQIAEKARDSAERVNRITLAAAEQSTDIGEVERAMGAVRELAAQTLEATGEQRSAGARIAGDLEQIRDLGLETQKASREQRDQSKLLTRTIEGISSRMNGIVEATGAQVAENENLASALDVFDRVGRDGEQRAETCEGMVAKLLERATRLQQAIDRFES